MNPQVLAKAARGAAAFLVLATGFIAGREGLFTSAYRDPVGIPTICYGHIEDVHMGDRKTVEACKELLNVDLARYDAEFMKCVHVPLTDERHAALLSFSYNVGTGGFCKSTLAKKLNAGDTRGACNELLKWDKAGHPPHALPGLTSRRKAERELCLRGVA